MNRQPARLKVMGIVALLTVGAACGGTWTATTRSVHSATQRAVAPSSKGAPASRVRGSTVFTATIVHPPGARVRYGPGLDMPVLDLDQIGHTETFDGWFRRADDTPLPDEITGRIEPWSRDWFHLADGRGWVHSAALRGSPPAAMAQMAWTPPAVTPAAQAGLVEAAPARQQHPLTCEVASLRMALHSRGIDVDELDLLRLTGVDPRPAELDGSGAIQRWGDPDQAFVGDPDGHEYNHTGYGVYAGPVARAARSTGATVVAEGTGIAPEALYAAIIAGHPAVAWVTNDFKRRAVRTWVAWDGSTVTYTQTEHAVLVVAVSPTQVLVNDPLVGQVWHSKADFESAYSTLSDMAVIVA
jgi:uncharacterized protein YvpB